MFAFPAVGGILFSIFIIKKYNENLIYIFSCRLIFPGSNSQKIAAAGYDTRDFRANDEAYKNLEECCQYKRKAATPAKPAQQAMKKPCCSKEATAVACCAENDKKDKSCCAATTKDGKSCCS